nr:pentatricopeptide repeat protein AaPPR963 [Agave angustifolia]
MNTASPHALKSKLVNLLQQPTLSAKSFSQIYPLLLTSGFTEHHPIALKITETLLGFRNPSFAYKALKQFHHHQQSPFLFNTLISGFAGTKSPHSAVVIYKHMVVDGVYPDKYTFPVILKSCAKFSGIGESKQLHGAAIKMGFSCDIYVQNALVNVYCICGDFCNARKLFDGMPERDVVSWTGLISGYVKGGDFSTALRLFSDMDVAPNIATLVSVLVACGRLGELNIGRRIHGLILKTMVEIGLIAGNAILGMYVKCEQVDEAKRVFEEIPERDIFSWTSLISGLVQCKRPRDAIEIFHEMQASGVEADKVVLSSVLSACASLGALDIGRWVHEYIDRKGIEWDVHIGTALVDMYAKCGCLERAVSTFHEMPCKNTFSWNALLGGLAMHGHGRDALDYFHRMIRLGFSPNDVTFIAILSACSHSGLVEEGRRFFSVMTRTYNFTPRIEHYGCMVDLLCRAGLLQEAYELVKSMPMTADVLIWGAMLSACKAQKNIELSQEILSHLLELEPCDSGVYVLLSQVFAMKDRWGDVMKVRRLMREKGIKKEPGSSAIEVNGKVHEFLVGEMARTQEEIWAVLHILERQLQLHGL